VARQPDGPKGDINWDEVWQKISGNKGSDDFTKYLKQGRVILILIGIAIAIWLLTGIYTVGPGEEGVVKTFGKHSSTASPGLNYHLPSPIQSHKNVDVEEIRTAEVGFRTVSTGSEDDDQVGQQFESQMLTVDGNIANVWLQVQYQVADPVKFLFNVRDPETVIHSSAEVVVRGIAGQLDAEYIITTGRAEIAAKTKDELQILLDGYNTGLRINLVNVIDTFPPKEVGVAYEKVFTSRQQKQQFINEATGYKNQVTEEAIGQKDKMILNAEAYLNQRVLEAQGDVIKFLKVLKDHEVPAAFAVLSDYGVARATEALANIETIIEEIAVISIVEELAETEPIESSPENISLDDDSAMVEDELPTDVSEEPSVISLSLTREELTQIMIKLGVVSTNQDPDKLNGKELQEAFKQLDSKDGFSGIEEDYNEAYSEAIRLTTERLYLETMESVLSETEKFIIDSQTGGNLMQILPLKELVGEDIVQTVPVEVTEEVVQ